MSGWDGSGVQGPSGPLCLFPDAAFIGERVLTEGTAVSFVDGGPDSTLTINVVPGSIDHGLLAGLADDDHPHYALNVGRPGEDMVIQGNLLVEGEKVWVDGESVMFADNHLLLNKGYTAGAAQTGGVVVNYDPTATVDTVAAGGFTAGVASTSNPTVITTGSAVFAATDIIQISGSTSNDGIFEVKSHVGTTLTIEGVGLTGTNEDFLGNQFVTEAGAGDITKVAVSVSRAGTDGVWETASGDSTGFSFDDVLGLAATQSPTNKSIDLANNTLTGTKAEYITACSDGTFVFTSDTLAVFAATTSAQLAGVISDETGSSLLVFNTSPTLVTPDVNGGTVDSLTALSIRSTGAAFDLTLASATVFTAGRTLTIDPGDAARTLTLSGNPTLSDWFDQSVKTTANPTFVNLTITSFAANWTNAGRTVADLGIVTTVDVNGGTIDGVTIGGASAGAITGTTITADTSILLEKLQNATTTLTVQNNTDDTAAAASLTLSTSTGPEVAGAVFVTAALYTAVVGIEPGALNILAQTGCDAIALTTRADKPILFKIDGNTDGVNSERARIVKQGLLVGTASFAVATEIANFEKNQNNGINIRVENTTDDTAAGAGFLAVSDASNFGLSHTATSYTPVAGIHANEGALVAAATSASLALITRGDDPIRFATDGDTDGVNSERAQINGTAFQPGADDRIALGVPGTGFSDAAFASGAVIDFGNTNYTATHSAGLLTLSGDLSLTNLTITSFAANWTNAGRTVADLGIVTTVDINGGTIDGVTIGTSGIDLSSNTLTGTKAEFDTACSDGNFAYSGGAFHDGFSDFVANEHIDWTGAAVDLSTTATVNAGAITVDAVTLTAANNDAVDVSDVSHIMIDTSGNNVAFGGTVNAVAGQILHVCVCDATNDTTMEDNEGTGNQDFQMHKGADETLAQEFGGWSFIFDGTIWLDLSHAQHV